MTCEQCGAKEGWVDGKKLERANESKREAMQRAKDLKEAVEEIREYNSMIPIHSKDPHVVHYHNRIESWCAKVLDA